MGYVQHLVVMQGRDKVEHDSKNEGHGDEALEDHEQESSGRNDFYDTDVMICSVQNAGERNDLDGFDFQEEIASTNRHVPVKLDENEAILATEVLEAGGSVAE